MNCRDIEREIRPFLDDLLSEQDYQDAHRHIESCPKCRQYVQAIGSLPHTLKELGEVQVPRGLAESILFQVQNRQPEAKLEGTQPLPVHWLSRAGIAVLIAATVFFAIHYFRLRQRLASQAEAPTVSVVQPHAAPDAAALALQQLQAISNALGVEQEDATGGTGGTPIAPPMEAPAPPADALSTSPKTVYVHWDFPSAQAGEGAKILAAAERSGASYDYKHSALAALRFSPEQYQRFFREAKNSVPDEWPGSGLDKGMSAQDKIHLSISLKNEISMPGLLHWHLSIPPAQALRLREMITQMGLTLEYDSPQLIVLTTSSTRIKELIAAVKTLGDASGNVNFLKDDVLRSYPVLISIYLTEV